MINLDQKYDRADFIDFLQNTFLADYVRDVRPVSTQGLSAIRRATSLGRSDSLDLQVFEFEYTGSVNKRVTLTKEAFQIMKQSATFNALAVFYGQDSDDWRLSFLTANPEKTEKGKVTLAYSNPRRYSFFLGSNAKINTPHRFLIKEGQIKNLDDLLSRFNVEIVTREFFENYKKLFDRLVGYLNKDHAFQVFSGRNGIDTPNFAKRLLGQIVFLYFLQRKGWLGAKKSDSISDGDKDFLRSLFNKSFERKANFYNEYLEKLFYGALNKPPEKAGGYYRSYFDCQVPFLNGGLFEPPRDYDWEGEFLVLPNKLFSSDPENPSRGDGILDIFDLYNFTVDESDFLDKEVSVDPEMLGKVFENLLEENLRKGKGTYYTPREIVNYMCEESLVNYLAKETETTPEEVKRKYFPAYNVLGDEKFEVRDILVSEQIIESLKNIKVVDPACGSGAFLVGMLQQITHLRHELENRSKLLGRRDTVSSEYDIKKQTIQNCIYGVDIDPGAVEIAKLRLWLSLVVDYELEDIEPLPNLDYKIMQGNSLLEELVLGDTTIKLYDRQTIQRALSYKQMKNLFEEDSQMAMFDDIEKEQALKNMKALQVKYFSQSDANEKKRIKVQIEKIEHDLIEASVKAETDKLSAQRLNIRTLPGVGLLPEDAKRLMSISSKESQIMAILDELKRTGTKPFFLWHLHFADVFEEKGGFDVVIANPPYGADIDKLTKTFTLLYPNTTKAFKDIYKIFIELGISKLLGNKGILCYIVPNTLLLQPRYKDVRSFLLNYKILEILNLGEEVFEQVVVPTCVIFIQNRSITNGVVRFSDLSEESKFNGNIRTVSFQEIEQASYNKTPANVFVSQNREIKDDEIPLEEIFEMKDCGIKYQRINVGLSQKGKNDLADRIFYEGEKLNALDKEFLIGKDLHRDGWHIDKTTKRFMRYDFRNLLKSNEIVYFNEDVFNAEEKIVWRQTSSYPVAALLDKSVWFANTLQAGLVKNDYKDQYSTKYILALLNSKLLRYIYTLFVKERGRVFPQVKLSKLRQLPIKKISLNEQRQFVEIVDNILGMTNSNDYLENSAKQTQVKEYRGQIDKMVYELYGLTEEEIRIVEGENE